MCLSLNMVQIRLSLYNVSSILFVSDVLFHISDAEIYFLCPPTGSTLISRVFYTNFILQRYGFNLTVSTL